uniref:NADH-ubiquinone oxidoreductase chain 2 n=1 Tax=Selaroides leptolepis TaxID=173311 RepID=A0A109WVI8_SELLE|nr:NADH dehydrogenase subunit 2 [Selaroides leptolepis]
MNPYILAFLLFRFGLGTTLTLASSHSLLACMGLEMNTLALIALMAQHHLPRPVVATTKFLLTQATAAALLLFASTPQAWLTRDWHYRHMSHPMPTTMITLALGLKFGMVPIHSSLPDVLEGFVLTTGLSFSSWHTLAPFALFVLLLPNNATVLMLLGDSSTLIAGWGGLKQSQLRTMLAYSSMALVGCMCLIIQLSPSVTLMTLFTYVVMTISSFVVFKIAKATNVYSLALSWTKTPYIASFAPFVLLSLGDLPPLTRLIPNWVLLQDLTNQKLAVLATLAALTALLSVYLYLRLSHAMSLTMYANNVVGTSPCRFDIPHLTLPLGTSTSPTMLLLALTPAITRLLTL